MTVLRGKRCLGFGEFDRKCEYKAGPNPYWCPRCDKLRIAHIDKRFAEISERFEVQENVQ